MYYLLFSTLVVASTVTIIVTIISTHKGIVLYARADWLVRKWVASSIYLCPADEIKSRVRSLISYLYLVYLQKVSGTDIKTTLSYQFILTVTVLITSGRC